MIKSIILMLAATTLCACTLPTEVINYRTVTDPQNGIYYVIDGVMDHGVLIAGTGTDQTRVYFTRQGN